MQTNDALIDDGQVRGGDTPGLGRLARWGKTVRNKLNMPVKWASYQMETLAGTRSFYSMPWQSVAADGLPRHYFIWGATAAMLRNFYRYLSL